MYFLSEVHFYLYSVDPDEMQHYAALNYMGHQFLQKISFRGFPNTNG